MFEMLLQAIEPNDHHRKKINKIKLDINVPVSVVVCVFFFFLFNQLLSIYFN